MFKVKPAPDGVMRELHGQYYICNGENEYLHSDGFIRTTAIRDDGEWTGYYKTKEEADDALNVFLRPSAIEISGQLLQIDWVEATKTLNNNPVAMAAAKTLLFELTGTDLDGRLWL